MKRPLPGTHLIRRAIRHWYGDRRQHRHRGELACVACRTWQQYEQLEADARRALHAREARRLK